MRAHARRTVVLAAAPLLLALAAGPAAAARPQYVPDRTPVTIALALEPASRSAFAAAGTAPSDVRRVAAAHMALPGAAAADDTTAYLRAHGFTVASRSRWLVTATGTAGAARAAFGAHLVRTAGQLQPTRPVGVPPALRGSVTGVIGLDTTPRWRPRAVPRGLTGTDLQSAYQVTAPIGTAAGITVATAQFSGWVRSDLQTYAAAIGVPMPAVTERAIGGAATKGGDGTGGEVEVALDHEALLAAAPGAAHLIFFGHNNDLGAVQLYDAVATAAEHDQFDVLSLSWGQCEFEIAPTAMRAINDALARIVAAGKTIFAAAGDAGALDCVKPALAARLAVDFPASSPYVVGVGGTRLDKLADGSWAEVGWNQSAPGGIAAGGGGFSNVFARPAWQPATTEEDPAGAKKRMVPDIAAVADPRSGFGVFASTHGGWVIGGGTSLASPVTAGHFAATLAAAGKRNGLGRALLPILYANPQAFRDVVEGTNSGYAAGPGYDRVSGLGTPLWDKLLPLIATGPIVSVPPVTRSLTVPVTVSLPVGRSYTRYRICVSNEDAHCDTPDVTIDPAAPYQLQLPADTTRAMRIVVVGFDANGLEFPGAAYTTYDVTPPAVSAAVRLTSPTSTTARFSWGATDPAPGGGVAGYQTRITRYGVTAPVRTYTGALTSWTTTLVPGAMYTLAVRATDTIGNISPWRLADIVVPLDQSQFTLAGPWATATTPVAYMGSWISSSTAGAQATAGVRGSSADLMFTSGPSGGLVDVYVGTVRAARVDTYAAVEGRQRLVRVASWRGPSARVITLRVAGARSSASKGSLVIIDGLRVNWRSV